MNIHCPACDSTNTKKNGHIHNGKQNHCCKECGRQFVKNPQQILISFAKRERIRRLLVERIPLRGICRTEGVSLRWLLVFMVNLYDQLPDDLNFQVKAEAEELIICTFESEIDKCSASSARKQTSSGWGNRREAAIRCNNSWRTDGIRLRGVENVPME